mgnify:CR=1 FL=1
MDSPCDQVPQVIVRGVEDIVGMGGFSTVPSSSPLCPSPFQMIYSIMLSLCQGLRHLTKAEPIRSLCCLR